MRKKFAIITVLTVYALTIFSYIWMDGSHTILERHINYSPTSFSLSNSSPLTWLIPIIGIGMLMLPWFWRVGFATKRNSYKFSIFPCSYGNNGKVSGILLSAGVTFVLLCAIIFTIDVGFANLKYSKEDLWLCWFCYITAGIFAAIINVCCGLFSPKNYKKHSGEV